LATSKKFDYIVIGSGFGGSVSAMRLSEKGYAVLVIEKGKRWQTSDFPKSNWNIRKYLWLPLLKCFGFQKLTFFKEVFILSGVGVGGGSLVYANTHMMPKESFYSNPIWAHIKDWKTVLAPYFERAKFMLGSEKYSKEYEEDRILKSVAEDMGRGDSYSRVNFVGVYQGDSKNEKDPYFNGLGPLRKGCTECAGCMVGCRYNAKNTLDKNYLWFAENMFGTQVIPETQVTKIECLKNEYHVHTESSTSWFGKKKQTFVAGGLIVSGGVLGTMDLLLRQKYVYKSLADLSDRLGDNILTNSEMLSGVVAADRKLNHGVAISTIFDPDEVTHIELCKFPDGSGAMMRLASMAAGNGTPIVRTLKMVGNIITQPWNFLRSLFNFKLAETSIIFLIMQSLPNAMQMKLRKGIFGSRLIMKNDSGQKVPSFIPIGQEALHRYAEKVNGVPHNAVTEIMFGLASTAHILGGCPMGKTKHEGVVDENFNVHGYSNLYILDGSIMPCNLGVNPSLTITALSEYAMDQIPAKEGMESVSLDQRLKAIALKSGSDK
jgi:cholesterol oxidase